ncbi:MAG: hypothetical protein NTX86_02790 [Candidatus Dependentiae bacterium]|nr:hypothetical protein [Candidatus Dependentiae bacterium]
MNYNKNIMIRTLLISMTLTTNFLQASLYDTIRNWFSAPKPMLVASVEKANEVLTTHLPATNELSSNFGSRFGYETVALIGSGLAATGAKVKAACITVGGTAKAGALYVAAAPATPYIVGGVVGTLGTYGTYKAYKYISQKPTSEQEIAAEKMYKEKEALVAEREFGHCLSNNYTSARNSLGVPLVCQSAVCRFAVAAGSQKVEEKLSAFNKYAPQ